MCYTRQVLLVLCGMLVSGIAAAVFCCTALPHRLLILFCFHISDQEPAFAEAHICSGGALVERLAS